MDCCHRRRVLWLLVIGFTICFTAALPGGHRRRVKTAEVVKEEPILKSRDAEVESDAGELVKAASAFAPIVVAFDNPEDNAQEKSERVVVSDPKTSPGSSGTPKQVSEVKQRIPAPVIEMQDEGDLNPEQIKARHHGGEHEESSTVEATSAASAAEANGTSTEPIQSRSRPVMPPEFRKNHAARPQLPPHKTAAMRDFIAQNDLFNATFPCSSQEKTCLDEERVLYDSDRQCYLLWRKGPCERGDWLVIDKNEANRGEGHFRAVCAPMRRCPDRQVLMAFDQKCHSLNQIIREICPKHEGLQLSYNVFGEGECKCDNCPAPLLPSNTFNEGRCAFPPSFYRSAVPVPEGLKEEMARMEEEEKAAAAAEADVVAAPLAATKSKRESD